MFKPAANLGLLCQGPPRGTNITFTDPTRWLGEAAGGGAESDSDPDEAMATVLARFLDAYGPATREDLARWLGITPKAARLALAAHAETLAEVRVEGQAAWMTPEGAVAAAAADPPEGVHLLPGFDPYVLAPLSHRAHTIPEGRIPDVSRKAGWISPVLLVDGRVAGTWESSTSSDVTTITITPFRRLPTAVVTSARRHARERYTPLLGPDLRVEVVEA